MADLTHEDRKNLAKVFSKMRPPKSLTFPNIDDYEWNSRWLQIEAQRKGIDPTKYDDQPRREPDGDDD